MRIYRKKTNKIQKEKQCKNEEKREEKTIKGGNASLIFHSGFQSYVFKDDQRFLSAHLIVYLMLKKQTHFYIPSKI